MAVILMQQALLLGEWESALGSIPILYFGELLQLDYNSSRNSGRGTFTIATVRRWVYSCKFMAGETILVVDDSAVNLKLADVVLRSEGYRVFLATSAGQALLTLRTTLPDMMLVDVNLPGMSGLELTRSIRQDMRTRELLVVVLSGSISPESQRQAFEAGCNGFIGKPIDTRTFGSRLRTFLDGAQISLP
jgi:two-component system, cell cycle response regulator DivK